MSINTTKLLSGRVPVVPYANLDSSRYEFLALGQAEPNLGSGADNSILTISTNNTRVWSNSITLSSISITGNVTAGNFLTSGLISATSTITSFANIIGGNLLTGGLVSATGNVTGNFILGNGSQLTGIITSVSNVVNGNSNVSIATANANVTISVSTVGNVAVFTPTGVSVLGNVSVSNTISATGNIYTAGYFVGTFAGNISGNLTVPGANTDIIYNNNGNAGASSAFTFNQSSNLMTITGNITATGNITGNYILGNGSFLTNVAADANSLTGNRLNSNVIYSNLQTVGTLANLSVSGNATIGNIIIVDTTLSSTGNLIAFAGADGIVLPTGNSAQRPLTPPTGTTRFNTTIDSTETWDGSAWVSGGNVIAPGSISNQQISPNGSDYIFSLTQSSTTAGVLVSINGVWQQPDIAYTVTGNSIAFTQTPYITDIIDVRFISYLTTISYLTNSAGNSAVNVSPSGNILFTTANNAFATMTDSYFNINYPISAAGNVTIGGLLTSPQQTKASNAAGIAGQICWDANYIYVCTALNTWKRTALTGGY